MKRSLRGAGHRLYELLQRHYDANSHMLSDGVSIHTLRVARKIYDLIALEVSCVSGPSAKAIQVLILVGTFVVEFAMCSSAEPGWTR